MIGLNFIMPISGEKTVVLHCGTHQLKNFYILDGKPISAVDRHFDLSVIMTSNSSFSEQCSAVVTKASRAAYVKRRILMTERPELIWPAYQSYVLPVISYCLSVWRPVFKCDDTAIEQVQRRFTKAMPGCNELEYSDCLNTLESLTLQQGSIYSDMVPIYVQ